METDEYRVSQPGFDGRIDVDLKLTVKGVLLNESLSTTN